MAFHMQMAHGSWLAQGFVHMSQPMTWGSQLLIKQNCQMIIHTDGMLF